MPQALGCIIDARRTNSNSHAIDVRRDAVDERAQRVEVRRPRGLSNMNPRAGAGRCWDVGHGWESDVGAIKQVVGHGAGDDGEARDELAQPPLPAPRPPPALLRRCCCSTGIRAFTGTRRRRAVAVHSVQRFSPVGLKRCVAPTKHADCKSQWCFVKCRVLRNQRPRGAVAFNDSQCGSQVCLASQGGPGTTTPRVVVSAMSGR